MDELLEEGEFREPMHGEVGDSNNLHGTSLGVINEKADIVLGVEVETEKVNSTHIFIASSNGLKSKRRPKKGADDGSIDLNKEAFAPVCSDTKDIDGGGGEGVAEQGVNGGTILDKEVEETVKIGAILGADLADHVGLVRNSIVDEGLGGLDKVPWLNRLKKDNGVDFMAIQETKAEDLSKFEGKCIWGNNNYGMEFVGSVGQSGGILSIWDKGRLSLSSSYKARNYLLVSGQLKGSNDVVNIINVYAPQGVADKQALWDSIGSLVLSMEGMWVVLGDFNTVRFSEERLGSVFKNSCARNFNSFIHNSGLLEYSMKGKKFTCIRDLDGFEEAVYSAARVGGVVAPPDVILTKKFGQIRDSIKRWKENILKIESSEEEDARAVIENLEVEMESRGHSEDEEWIYAEFGANMNRISNWKPVFDVFESRLTKWKADCLSIGGRVTLIKYVLESLPVYFFSLYKAPCKVIKDLESFISRFLWGGSKEVHKIHWVAWDRVCYPKKCGGLGLCKLKFINTVLLAKWGWRFKKERGSLWCEVVEACHITNRSWDFLPVRKSLNGVWSNIIKVLSRTVVSGMPLRRFFKGKVGNGNNISFWIDPWLLNLPLMVVCPNLFRLDSDKRCKVSDRLKMSDASIVRVWKWKRSVTAIEDGSEWEVLNSLLDTVVLSDSMDSWVWIGVGNGVFSVSAVRNLLYLDMDFSNIYVFEWCKWIPKKCNIFGWRAEMGRIPTASALRHINILIADVSCVLCGSADESVDHLFTGNILNPTPLARVKKLAVVKDKATDKVSDVLVEKKAEKEKDKKIKLKFKVMEPVKTTPKSSEKKSAKVLSEASVLRSKKQKEIEKEETQTKRKLVLAKVDDSSKKQKHKVKKGIEVDCC
ncbi:RNA-directed DNA polymerase, eukaryota [Artemisia annua]|uniref:RNA-directed DNA polymerase, eukaryota n=1 Tax=Artemisia annua TaxID=35608 RepID=A0A2U1KT40_ARTAN|nr:RNA-directed DNA polymerase, eukaryota [Artemisia annua]